MYFFFYLDLSNGIFMLFFRRFSPVMDFFVSRFKKFSVSIPHSIFFCQSLLCYLINIFTHSMLSLQIISIISESALSINVYLYWFDVLLIYSLRWDFIVLLEMIYSPFWHLKSNTHITHIWTILDNMFRSDTCFRVECLSISTHKSQDVSYFDSFFYLQKKKSSRRRRLRWKG